MHHLHDENDDDEKDDDNDDGHGVHYDPGSPDDHTLMVIIIHCLDVRGLAVWL